MPSSVLCVILSLLCITWCFVRVWWFFLVPLVFLKHHFWCFLNGTCCICFCLVQAFPPHLFSPSTVCSHTLLTPHWSFWFIGFCCGGFVLLTFLLVGLFSLGTYWRCLFPNSVSLPVGHVKLTGQKTFQNYPNFLPAEYFFCLISPLSLDPSHFTTRI